MKRYVKSSYSYDPWKNADMSEWSESDIATWESIDWKARNYEEYYIPEDSFEGYVYIYGIPGGIIKEPVTFMKTLSANTIYSPKYDIPDWYKSDIYKKYKEQGYAILSPMYNGHTHVTDGIEYKVMDRSETQETYDMLSR